VSPACSDSFCARTRAITSPGPPAGQSALGCPHIYGELLKLGFAVAQSTVGKYMARTDRSLSGQRWGNHLPHIDHRLQIALRSGDRPAGRRELVWINVTAYPAAEWIAQQITEAFPRNEVPRYLIHDRDAIYGTAVRRAMGIRDKPIAPGSPWQNSFVERLIGTIRRERADHVVAVGEEHLRRVLRALLQHGENAPLIEQGCTRLTTASAEWRIVSHALVGGLHHQYVRI
jgi:hypothetical protein